MRTLTAPGRNRTGLLHSLYESTGLADAIDRLRNGPARPPQRTGAERCSADHCDATVNPFDAADPRRLPFTPEEMARCEVPPADGRTSALKATEAVARSRPDLAPVWCSDGCGWHHSVCYSTHHRPGWTPAPADPHEHRRR